MSQLPNKTSLGIENVGNEIETPHLQHMRANLMSYIFTDQWLKGKDNRPSTKHCARLKKYIVVAPSGTKLYFQPLSDGMPTGLEKYR